MAPTVSTVLVTPTLTRVGNSVSATGGFTDPGVLDTHSGTWSWGDGTTSVAAITESNGTGTASGNHNYSRAGIFVVTLTVADDDSGSGTASFAAVVVVDPSAGSVAGGGWITLAGPSSLPGDRLPGTPAGTRTTFALSAGYRTTTSTSPVGTLQVDTPRFYLSSTRLDWMVVTGDSATVQGTAFGAATQYVFRVEVRDAPGADRFELRLWAAGRTRTPPYRSGRPPATSEEARWQSNADDVIHLSVSTDRRHVARRGREPAGGPRALGGSTAWCGAGAERLRQPAGPTVNCGFPTPC